MIRNDKNIINTNQLLIDENCNNIYDVINYIYNIIENNSNINTDNLTIEGSGTTENPIKIKNLNDDKIYLIKNGALYEYQDPSYLQNYFSLDFGCVLTPLLKNNTYCIGLNSELQALTIANDRPSRRLKIPFSCQIVRVQIMCYLTGTLPSSENIILKIRNITQQFDINIIDNYKLSSGNLSGQSRLDIYDIPIQLNNTIGDDFIQMQIITPNWITEPSNVGIRGNIYFKKL